MLALVVLVLASCDPTPKDRAQNNQPSIPQALKSEYCDHLSMWQSAILIPSDFKSARTVEETARELRMVERYLNGDARRMSQLGFASSASAIREVAKAISVYRRTEIRAPASYAVLVAFSRVNSALKRVPIRCPSRNT